VRRLLDFDVVIESYDDGFRARVVASPAGQAEADFALPFSDKDLRILVLEVVGSIGRVRRQVRRIDSPDRLLLENFGDRLYQAAFSGQVGECLGRSRLVAESKGVGLRIRLRLPQPLASIPWEYLYDAEHGFLGLDPDTALVRYPELPAPVKPFPISPPLRILAMISSPNDLPPLDVEEEWDKLNGTLSDLDDRGMVRVDRLEDGTLAALRRRLQLQKYHVLHFIGHGGFDEKGQDGALALEAADGKTRLVTGRNLAMMIHHRALRLAVLNACEGGRVAQDDPYSGVAQALVRHGIPAVIAMQFEISDPAALAFSQSFYQGIADGLPIDVATVEARRAMFAEGNEIEWATPVLYLRSPDGRVFTRGLTAKTEQREAEQREAEQREAEQREAEQREAEQREAEQREAEQRATIPVAGPIVLIVPLLILALKLLDPSYHFGRAWPVVILCTAILGSVVTAVEARQHKTPIWTIALEFVFMWLAIYAIYRLNIGHIHRISSQYTPLLTILAGVGAIFSAALLARALTTSARDRRAKERRTVHRLLPVFLGCLTAGFCAAAISYAGQRYTNVEALAHIGPTISTIGGVFILATLLVSLLAPFLALTSRRQGPSASHRPK
jgi:CHAT domain